MLKDYGCAAKRRGKNISVTAPFSKKPIRLSSLSVEFDELGIKSRIAEQQKPKQQREPQMQTFPQAQLSDATDYAEMEFPADNIENESPDIEPPILKFDNPHNLKLIIDIQKSMKASESIGYKKWAEKFNLEQMSQTLLFIEKHQLSLPELENMALRKPQMLRQIMGEIEKADESLQNISALQRHIGTLDKTRDIYKRYAQSGFSAQFREANLKSIAANESSKKYLKDNGYGGSFGKELPTIHELKTRYAKTHAHKTKLWTKYHDTRNSGNGIINAWENVKAILNIQTENEIVPTENKIAPKPKLRNSPSL